MQTLPYSFEYVKLVYVQLHLCLKALDALGLEMPAVHLDASIRALREEIEGNEQKNMDATLAKDFIDLDTLISLTWSRLGDNT